MAEDDLFSATREETKRAQAPLAARMRPRTIDEVIGQQHLLGDGAAFRSMIEAGSVSSMILWGPPGTGKTTLARLVAAGIRGTFEQLSATSAGVKDVREVLARADQRLGEGRGRTVLILDEIHRFNKAQQDALLPGVEDGTVILVGATTENPFFEVNSPLISRATVFRTEPLTTEDISTVVRAAVEDPIRGIRDVTVAEDAIFALAERVGGDARLALNTLEAAATIAVGRSVDIVDVAVIEEALQRRVIRYDRTGDRHYDVISAFIKSMRGSDPDASLYWLHTMLEAGEDPRLIARRMVVFASEDIGLADSSALGVAVDAFRALEFVGLPEAAYNLTHAVLALSLAPKSNSVKESLVASRHAISEGPHGEVPAYLRSGSTAGDRSFGFGVGYEYPHDDPMAVVSQTYLPEGSEDLLLYRPKRAGGESELADRLAKIDAILGKENRFPADTSDGT